MKSYFQRVVDLNGRARVYRVAGFLLTLVAVRFILAHGYGAPRVIADTGLYLAAGLMGVVFHEWAHAVTATAAGDRVPRMDGRLSLNPLVHLDFLGSLCLVLIGVGWARPVRITTNLYYRRPWTLAGITFAGPAANFILGTAAAGLLLFLTKSGFLQIPSARLDLIDIFTLQGLAAKFLLNLVLVNSLLGVFNLIPIPPLDGGALLMLAFTKDPGAAGRVSGHGFVFLLILMAFARVDTLIGEAGLAVARALFGLAGHFI